MIAEQTLIQPMVTFEPVQLAYHRGNFAFGGEQWV
jgi:hypothetical protein